MAAAETVTILFTDLVGSTEHSTSLTPAAADEFRRGHFAVLREVVAATGGTEVKNLGDGLMVAFTSTTAALDCAIGMQRAIARHNRRKSVDVAIRIGLSAGDVSVEEDDYFGEPVIEAARLCALAEGRGILATDVVRLLGQRSNCRFANEREVALKGLPRTATVYDIEWTPDVISSPLPLPPRLPRLPLNGVVGRTHERVILEEAVTLGGGSSGAPRIVLLSGEAGIGKSTLVAWSCRTAFADGAAILYGRCDEDLVVPYQPFVDVLEQLIEHLKEATLTSLGDERLSALVRIVPALRRRLPSVDEARATDPDAERWLLFGAVIALLEEVAAESPVVIVLDDLHWADRQTLQLIRYMASELDGRVLLLATYRDAGLSALHPLTELLAALRREDNVVRIPLAGLRDSEVLAFLEAAAGHAMDETGERLAHAVHRETDGNPFFVAEVLRHLVETKAIAQDESGRWVATRALAEVGLPESLRQVIGARVGRLGTEASRVLFNASVLGQEFDVDTLASISGVSEDSVLEVLEAARTAALVAEVRDTPGRFRFGHALVQHTLYEDLGTTRRARLHRATAEVLERRYRASPESHAAELAHHWLAATRPQEAGRAIGYARAAGDNALQALAPAEAIRWYGEALSLLAFAPDDAERARCLAGLGEAQRQAGDGAFRETLLTAAHLAREVGDAGTLVRAALANNRGWVSRAGVLDQERIDVLGTALEVVHDHETVQRARLLALLALERTFDGNYAARRALSDEALAIARRAGDDATLLEVLLRRPWQSVWMPDTVVELHKESDEVLEIAARVGDPVGKFWAATIRSALSLQLGDIDEVQRCEADKHQLAKAIGQPILEFVNAFSDGWLALLSGDTALADQKATEVLQRGTDTGQPDPLAFYGAQLHHIRWHQGRTVEIADVMAHVVEEHPDIAAFRGGAAHVLMEAGRLDEAAALLAREKASQFQSPKDFLQPAYLDLWARVASGLADAEAAAALYARLAHWPRLVVFTVVTVHGAVAHNLGTLAAVCGRDEEADAHFATALEIHQRMRAPFFIALTQLEWARMLQHRGHPSRADELISSARSLALEHGYGAIERATSTVASNH